MFAETDDDEDYLSNNARGLSETVVGWVFSMNIANILSSVR